MENRTTKFPLFIGLGMVEKCSFLSKLNLNDIKAQHHEGKLILDSLNYNNE